MEYHDKDIFDEFKEYFMDNKCVFEGKIKSFYKDLDKDSIFYCVNGGGMMRDGEIERKGLYFFGSYYFPDIFEIRECEREELFKVYHLPEYTLCENEVNKRKKIWKKRKNEKARKKRTYPRYKYYAKTKFGDVIESAYSMGKLAEKMGVGINTIRYRKKYKPKNSRYVDFEVNMINKNNSEED